MVDMEETEGRVGGRKGEGPFVVDLGMMFCGKFHLVSLHPQVSKREVQKINTYCLPVPSSATSFDVPDPVAARNVASASCVGITAASDRSATAAAAAATIVIEEDEEEDIKSKNLVSFLGMKDGFTASMASQVRRLSSRSEKKSHQLLCHFRARSATLLAAP